MATTTGTAGVRQASITCSVTWRGETRDLGIWDTWSGANVTADNTKHRRGAMGAQVSIGGPKTIEDLTIGRDYDLSRDNVDRDMNHWLANRVGEASVVATKTFLDANGAKFGKPIVITGILIGYNGPTSDSDAADIAMVELVINPDGVVG